MSNVKQNDAREDHAKINTDEMETLRDLLFRTIECGEAGANIKDEIEHLLTALNVADRNSVCRVADFIADGLQAGREADSDLADSDDIALLTTYDTLYARLNSVAGTPPL
jgi:hypothetical protein